MTRRSLLHCRPLRRPLLGVAFALAGLLGALTTTASPSARADVTAYLIAVTMRPGYHFASAEAALSYGHGICDKVSQGRTYPQVVGDVKADFNTSDEFQAAYL